ncbi:hypothetical protein VTN49DRAFT_7942 [Thermomyces lanuginosus]|uniref:uncharacterized protein n=1 Tax=Thermomyces lanuginosus TaxID=5541 RepID=UPI0037433441
MLFSSSLLSLLLPVAYASTLDRRNDTVACNNSPSLCDKSYGEITHLGAHDSPFVRDESTDFSTSGNQFYNTTVQLSAGVRLVTGQVHKENNELHMCHTSCELLDAGTLESWLKEIKAWLDDNPNDVVTVLLVNSDNVDAATLGASFEAAEIADYAYTPSAPDGSQSWPTLQELIDANTRLMAFVASLSSDSSVPYLMNEFDYIFETPFENTAPSNFSCQPDRPKSLRGDLSGALASGRLPLVNHFLYSDAGLGIQVPNVDAIDTTNGDSGEGNLEEAATTCQEEYSGRQPTFLLVDFFDKGSTFTVLDKLNNVTDATGRRAVPGTNEQSTNSGGKKSALKSLVNQAKAGARPSIGNWIWVGGSWGVLGGGLAF